MENQIKLSKVIFELLVERGVKSFDVIQATDLLFDNYSKYYTWRKLYLHIYTQSQKLQKNGLLEKIGKPEEIKYRVTKKFSANQYISYKTVSLLRKESEMIDQAPADYDNFFYSEIENEMKLIDYRILCFRIERDLLDHVKATHSTCPAIVKELHNEASNELNSSIVKRNTLLKILNSR